MVGLYRGLLPHWALKSQKTPMPHWAIKLDRLCGGDSIEWFRLWYEYIQDGKSVSDKQKISTCCHEMGTCFYACFLFPGITKCYGYNRVYHSIEGVGVGSISDNSKSLDIVRYWHSTLRHISRRFNCHQSLKKCLHAQNPYLNRSNP